MRSIKRQVLDDRLFLWQSRAARKPFFHGGTESPPLADHVQALDFELPDLPKQGRAEFTVKTLAGELRAAIHVHAIGTAKSPVVIYHHDAGEMPVTRMLRQMFPDKAQHGLAVFGVEAPFHQDIKDFKVASADMLSYLAMQAVAVAVTEQLLRTPRVREAPLRGVSGYGQGGYIANRHHMMFDTADVYVPFMAGAAQAEPFLKSLPTASSVKRRPDALRKLLNFDREWTERERTNVFPVLGSADVVNEFNAQAQSYGDTPIEVWALGHLAKNPERMRHKIVRHLREAAFQRGKPIEMDAVPARNVRRVPLHRVVRG